MLNQMPKIHACYIMQYYLRIVTTNAHACREAQKMMDCIEAADTDHLFIDGIPREFIAKAVDDAGIAHSLIQLRLEKIADAICDHMWSQNRSDK